MQRLGCISISKKNIEDVIQGEPVGEGIQGYQYNLSMSVLLCV
jgi:hypothetical protein